MEIVQQSSDTLGGVDQHHLCVLCQAWSAYSSYLILKLICLTLIAVSTNSLSICLLLSLALLLNLSAMLIAQHFPHRSKLPNFVGERMKGPERREEGEKCQMVNQSIAYKRKDAFVFSKESFAKELVPLHTNQLTSSLFSLATPSPSLFLPVQ